MRLIAGDVAGHHGPGSMHTPITVAHATIAPGARLSLPWRADFNALAYVLSGRGAVGVEAAPVEGGQTVVFAAPGDTITIDAAGGGAAVEVLLLGWRPIRKPVAAYGPFVMHTRAELVQAVDDYNAGRLGTIPADGLRPFRR